ncbi:MAG: LysE family translocator [Patescibacteria group bacterium]
MDFLSGFLVVTVIAIFGVISPGPDTAIIVKNSITRSRKDGIWTAAGIVVGNVVYVTLALMGFGAVLTSSVTLFTLVKLCGALYLVFLGLNLIFSKRQELPSESGALRREDLSASFREGLITNFGNPKFMVFVLALFTQVIDPSTPFLVQALYAYQIPLIAFVWFSTLSVVLTTGMVRTRISGFMHHVERAMGVVLVALGITVALGSD